MPIKPNVANQLSRQAGLGRTGGMMSQGSNPVMKGTKGAGFSAMENTLLKGPSPNPKALAAAGSGNTGRQFFTQAAGGDMSTGLPKVPGKVSTKPKKWPVPKFKA